MASPSRAVIFCEIYFFSKLLPQRKRARALRRDEFVAVVPQDAHDARGEEQKVHKVEEGEADEDDEREVEAAQPSLPGRPVRSGTSCCSVTALAMSG